ncbi:uncharacterized protein BKA78DRAFT_296384 [Phyllosticta capitalensis]|uniref:Uncharacterized protein n=1 Tax=Phyllosticta capitalensis TaxID=121624 RepID=A0ABR1YN41_9PEZI
MVPRCSTPSSLHDNYDLYKPPHLLALPQAHSIIRGKNQLNKTYGSPWTAHARRPTSGVFRLAISDITLLRKASSLLTEFFIKSSWRIFDAGDENQGSAGESESALVYSLTPDLPLAGHDEYINLPSCPHFNSQTTATVLLWHITLGIKTVSSAHDRRTQEYTSSAFSCLGIREFGDVRFLIVAGLSCEHHQRIVMEGMREHNAAI